MARLNFLDRAKQDLVDIVAYIGRQSASRDVAHRFSLALMRQCHHLASLPAHMGRPRPELGADLRSVAHGNYIIVFRYVGARLDIVRILEGHRDIETQFADPDV